MPTEGQSRAVEQCRKANTKTILSTDGLSKTCLKCGVMKHRDDFHVLKRGILERNAWCKSCQAEYKAAWDSNNRERKQETSRAYYSANRDRLIADGRRYRVEAYGISLEEYAELARNGCWLCGSPDELHIDHDHSCCPEPSRSCGTCVRGILCRSHNHGIGNFADDPVLLLKAVDYLMRLEEGEPCWWGSMA